MLEDASDLFNLSLISLECPAGFYCKGTDSTGPHAPQICPKGHHCEVGTFEPEPCPAGKFSAFEGAKNESECTDCPAGHFCLIGTTAINESNKCREGYYCPTGTALEFPPTRCGNGLYCPGNVENLKTFLRVF